VRRPALVCINNGTQEITRYVPKPTGGFYTESFDIIDREQFEYAATVETIEQVRLGRMTGQVTPPELVEQEYA
jgi:hypothetical protein